MCIKVINTFAHKISCVQYDRKKYSKFYGETSTAMKYVIIKIKFKKYI